MNDLLRVADIRPEELVELLDTADRVKADRAALSHVGRGKAVAVLFEKPSLRTRFSLEVALIRIGAHPVGDYGWSLAADAEDAGSREPLDDAGRVLDRYVDAICLRTFSHAAIERLAEVCEVPVVNALSDDHHPLQALADLQTIRQATGDLEGRRVAFVGDGNNVCHSLVEAAAIAGMHATVACPSGYEPDPSVVSFCGDALEVTDDPTTAVKGADVVYTDVWTSMGQEAEAAERTRIFEPYRVSSELMGLAAPDAIFLHCLPAHRGEEVAAAVIDGPSSRVFDQAENRVHTAAAVLAKLLGGP